MSLQICLKNYTMFVFTFNNKNRNFLNICILLFIVNSYLSCVNTGLTLYCTIWKDGILPLNLDREMIFFVFKSMMLIWLDHPFGSIC